MLEKELMIVFLTITIATIGAFWIFREVVCWYWKINEAIKNQKEQIRLLRKIAGEPEIKEEILTEEVELKESNF